MAPAPNMHPSMQHILEVVFALPEDSPLHRAMANNMYTIPEDFLMEKDDVLDDLAFKGDDKKLAKIPKGGAGLLKSLKHFVTHLQTQGVSFGSNNWSNITRDQFNNFRISSANGVMPSTPTSSTTPPPPTPDPVREFKRGIKRDITQFTAFKDDAMWDNWNRSTVAQARAQDIAHVLDPSYIP